MGADANLLMLDSGAFSVWNRGEKIDLDQYSQFCVDHPQCSYYVNLDVIPGRPNDPKSMTAENIEGACRQGWSNYLKLLRRLPEEKVIPVFHMGDGFQWLEKYLDFGSPYIGISPANDRTSDQKMAWLQECKKYIFDAAGNPIVKTHGFAVTSFRLMKAMQWHSVDSASWVRHSSYGTIYVPIQRAGAWQYDQQPFLLNVSPKSPSRNDFGAHITTLSPLMKQIVFEYLDAMGMGLGAYELIEVGPRYKKKKDGELWLDSKKQAIIRIQKKGLMTCHQQRFWMNMKFIHKANRVLPVDHVYFAGNGMIDQIEFRLGRRLLSYHEILVAKDVKRVFNEHMERMANRSSAA